MSHDALIHGVERYYSAKVAEHGATPLGVDWNDEAGQQLRFEQLLAVVGDAASAPSINDFGCGYGGLLDVLRRRYEDFSYCGYDVSEAMVQAAQKRYAGDVRARFLAERARLQPADFTLASGIFNVRLSQPEEVWRSYVLQTLDDLVALSRRGVAFNALTSHSDEERMRPDLFYADPAFMLDHCLSRYSRNVVVDHDYELYEFTVLVRLDGRPPATRHERSDR